MTRFIYVIFVFLLIFSPLALGTVETWSLFIMEALAMLAFLLLVLGDRKRTFYETPGLLPLVLFLAYMLLQLVPLPAGWVRVISSSTYAVYEQTIGRVEPVNWMTLSMNKKATASEFFRMAAYSCFYILTVQLLSDQKLLKRTVKIVIGYTAVLAFLTLVLKLFVTIGFFGFRKIAVWENHLEGFFLMTYPLALALFFYYLVKGIHDSLKQSDKQTAMKQRIKLFITHGKSGISFVFMLSVVLMAAAIVASFSYACIITLCFSTGGLLILLATKREFRKSSGIILFVFVIFLFIISTQVDVNTVYGELKQVRNGSGEVIKRKHLWMDSAWIMAMFPLTGIGFGAFKSMYPAYTRIPVIPQNRSQGVKHAHNEVIELITEGGVIAFLLRAWFFIVVLLRSFLAYGKRRESYSNCLFLAGITGFVAVSLYSLAEPNLHIGANGLYFFLLFGLIISASHTRLRKHLEPTKLGKSKFSVRKRLAVPAFSTLVACLIFNAFLIFNPGALVEKSWASSNDATWIQVDGETYGAQADQRGPIGGGRGYMGIVTTGDFVVENLDQLLDALAKAKAGQVIFIPGKVEIDCTARVYIEQLVLEIPGGVTLASNRGDKDSKGALIYSDALKTPTLIRPMGPNVRITGLRIRGPNPKRYMGHHHRSFAEGRGHEYYYKFPTSEGIRMEHSGLEVDNCEISGFGHAGINLAEGDRHHIHHCFIHHCQHNGLGYGVRHNIASSLIERNQFDFNRHSIEGNGRPGCNYEARHNVELGTSLSHCFDMHGSRDRKDGTDIAGTRILIHHNTFHAPNTPIRIRGVPEDVCKVYGNWFPRHMNPQDAVSAYKNTQVRNNAYGTLPVRVIK